MTPDPPLGEQTVPTHRVGWLTVGLATLAVAEVALVGWALSARAPVLFILGQLLLLALLAVVVLYRRYTGFRRAYESDIAHRAAEKQRVELAGELHDVLGHELSLIALRAAALQVHASGSAAEAAGQVRAQVEQAVVQLSQTMALLRPADSAPTSLASGGRGLLALVERANAAGADVTLTGMLADTVPGPIQLTAYRVAQEGLTNAAKHSPGAHVDILVHETSRELKVLVETTSSDGGQESAAAGSGLSGLQHRVAALGGDLSVTDDDGRHITRARLPLRAESPANEVGAPALRLARRPMAATARSALVPLAIAATVVVAFYTWASHGATLEQRDFDTLDTGQPTVSSQAKLPSRQTTSDSPPPNPSLRGGCAATTPTGTSPWPWPPTRSATTAPS